MIRFDNVTLRYPYDEFDVLKGASFRLSDGLNTVLCDTQSGKTTICRLLIKDIAPCQGEIYVDDVPLASIADADLDILYLPCAPVFFERRSVKYNLEYPLRVRKMDRRRAVEVAERSGLSDMDRKVSKLSASERKTLAIARGLTVPRKYVLLDDFAQSLTELEEYLPLFEGSNVIVFTSDPSLAKGNTVVLDGGRAVFQGDAESAKSKVGQLQYLFDSLRNNNG